jgi:hypothetical protein
MKLRTEFRALVALVFALSCSECMTVPATKNFHPPPIAWTTLDARPFDPGIDATKCTAVQPGPVYATLPPTVAIKSFNKVLWRADSAFSSRTLIRAHLVGGTATGLLNTGTTADVSGLTATTRTNADNHAEQLYPELRFDGSPDGLPSFLWVEQPGCWAFQVDSASFTEYIVFSVS